MRKASSDFPGIFGYICALSRRGMAMTGQSTVEKGVDVREEQLGHRVLLMMIATYEPAFQGHFFLLLGILLLQ